ncbi:hypothetical protein KTH_03820 [Thermosporothrix hazakensis]|nr:hypothetical protein KTH_03820 [Thermosporothrix hazakensis]
MFFQVHFNRFLFHTHSIINNRKGVSIPSGKGGEMKRVLLGLVLSLAALFLTTTSVSASAYITWKKGSFVSFSQSAETEDFRVSFVDGRSESEGMNRLSMEFECSRNMGFKVDLYNIGEKRIIGTKEISCSPGARYRGSVWLPIKQVDDYYFRFYRTHGSGTITVISYEYFYYKS